MTKNIGWIGLGKMGIPMSLRLIDAGHKLTVFNRTKGKDDILVSRGALVAGSPSEVVSNTDIIILMVSDDNAVREIFIEKNGLLSTGTRGKIIINMSTISPGISMKMASRSREKSMHYIDAPVSGSVKQAESGELVIMAGGEEEIYNKVKPIFDHLGKLSIRVGDAGAGNTAKLAVNSLLGIISLGLSESVIFARNNGIRVHDLITIINNSAMGSPYLRIKGDAILNDRYEAAFALKHIVKDLRLAKESGLNTPAVNTAYDTFKKAEPEFGEQDIITVIKSLKK
jgi:3-hydroxyisobutyrate dehydrogenase